MICQLWLMAFHTTTDNDNGCAVLLPVFFSRFVLNSVIQHTCLLGLLHILLFYAGLFGQITLTHHIMLRLNGVFKCNFNIRDMCQCKTTAITKVSIVINSTYESHGLECQYVQRFLVVSVLRRKLTYQLGTYMLNWYSSCTLGALSVTCLIFCYNKFDIICKIIKYSYDMMPSYFCYYPLWTSSSIS